MGAEVLFGVTKKIAVMVAQQSEGNNVTELYF